MQLPISVGQPDVAADIGEAMQAAQVQAAQAQAALAAYKSIGLMQSLELQPNSCPAPDAAHPKVGAAGPPAPCGGQPFPNLLQQAARGPVPVAVPADPAAGQFYYGPGVYRGTASALVQPVPPFSGQ